MWTRVGFAILLTTITVACGFGTQGGGGHGLGPGNAMIDLNSDVTVDNQPDSPNLTFTLGANATLHFTITDVGNKPSDQLITITVTLPAGISYVSSASVNGTWSCNASGQTITCTSSFSVPGLTNGLAIFTMNVTVANNAQGPAQLSVSISTPDGTPTTNGGAKGVNFVAGGGGGGAGGGTNALCKPQGSESALKGSWIFLAEGENGTDGHMAVGASLVADGAGGITSAAMDLALPFVYPISSYAVEPSSNNTGSSYSLDNTGRGCLALVSGAFQQIFRIVMAGYSNGTPGSGYVMDVTAPEANIAQPQQAIGLMVPGAGNATAATLNGSYAFGVAGRGINPNCGGAACTAPISAAGNIKFDGNGGINTATNGLGDSDIGSVGISTQQPIAAGSYSLSSNGRGTISFTDGNVPIKGIVYVGANGGTIFILSQTPINPLGNNPPAIVTGRAVHFGGMGASPNAALSGFQLLAIDSAKAATAGIVNLVPSNANTTDGTVAGTIWQAGGGNSQSAALNGTYSVTDAAFGRVTFTGLGNNPPVLYATGGNNGLDGFFVGTNGGADTGRMLFQSASATNYSDASFPSGFKAVFTQFERNFQSNAQNSVFTARIGQITFDGVGGISGTYDENGPSGVLRNQAINANYSMNTDGSGSFEHNTWPWVSRIDHSCYIDENASNLNPVVNDVAKQ